MWIYFVIPIVSGLIGLFTNDLAVRMLFRPRKPVNLLFFKLQGVFPKRKAQIAENIGEMVANKLIHPEKLKEWLGEHVEEEEGHGEIHGHIRSYLDEKIRVENKFFSRFVSDSMIEGLSSRINKEVQVIMPQIKDSYLQKAGGMDIKGKIQEQIMNFSEVELEKALLTVMQSELNTIKWMGGIIGLIVGLFQVLIMIWLA